VAQKRGQSGLTLDQETAVKSLKEQLQNQNRNLQNLRHQIESIRNQKRSDDSSRFLYEEKAKMDRKLFESRQDLQAIESDVATKKRLFNRNKEYHQSIFDQHSQLRERRDELLSRQRSTAAGDQEIQYVR
jgi:chromosome segregation ATPase